MISGRRIAAKRVKLRAAARSTCPRRSRASRLRKRIGDPVGVGSFGEIGALTTNGKYVFNVSTESAPSDIGATRQLAGAINTHLAAH